eukprot:265380-Chlamydomonas_euryale.AAC.2
MPAWISAGLRNLAANANPTLLVPPLLAGARMDLSWAAQPGGRREFHTAHGAAGRARFVGGRQRCETVGGGVRGVKMYEVE